MESFIAKLMMDFCLPEDVEFTLDSIAFQEKQAGIPPRDIERDLMCAASIAKRYDDPVAALRKLDCAIPVYLKRREKSPGKVGSFEKLNGGEARRAGGENLDMSGLDGRICAYLLGTAKQLLR